MLLAGINVPPKKLDEYIRESFGKGRVRLSDIVNLYRNTASYLDISSIAVIVKICCELSPEAEIPEWMIKREWYDGVLGPHNPTVYKEKKNHRMFSTYGVAFPDWFTGNCNYCFKRISHYRRSIRLPKKDGTWKHCLCSSDCARIVNKLETGSDHDALLVLNSLNSSGIPDVVIVQK